MSVTKVSSTHAHAHLGTHRQAAHAAAKTLDLAKVGEEVNLRIVGKVADGRFLAASGDKRYAVDSSLSFVVGETIKATVSALGGIVELKYRGGGQFEALNVVKDAELTAPASDTHLDKLMNKYKQTLSTADRERVIAMSEQVSNQETMAAGALYLSKLRAPVEDDALHALYAQQVWNDSDTRNGAQAADISALIAGAQRNQDADIATLSKLLGDAVDQSSGVTAQAQDALAQMLLTSGGGAAQFESRQSTSDDAADSDALKELARRLLNTQDAGTIGYHYGTLPVIISNQLVELDLVMFRERDSASRAQGLRKLVMTLKTETLGRVEIVAQSLDNSLSVSIATQSPDATEKLAAQAQEVRDLVTRLGWNVDSVAYRLATNPMRAAEQLVRHVLNSGTLDAVV